MPAFKVDTSPADPATAAAGSNVVVGVGDCRIACYPSSTVSTYALGSCIALIAWDWRLKVGGILHFMLPDSAMYPQRPEMPVFAYADTGLPAFLRLLARHGSARKDIRWSATGGAGMLVDLAYDIGTRNQLALRSLCNRLGVHLSNSHVGGQESRCVKLVLKTGRVDVRTGSGQIYLLEPECNGVLGG